MIDYLVIHIGMHKTNLNQRKPRLQIKEDLGWKVTDLKLDKTRTICCQISAKMCPSSCDLYTQYQFMCEMQWLTVHLLYT